MCTYGISFSSIAVYIHPERPIYTPRGLHTPREANIHPERPTYTPRGLHLTMSSMKITSEVKTIN